MNGSDFSDTIKIASSNDTLIVRGSVHQSDPTTWAISADGIGAIVNITKTGSTIGVGGVLLAGLGATLNNAGLISGFHSDTLEYLVRVAGHHNSVVNSGVIEMMGGGGVVAAAVHIDRHGKLTNDGTIKSGVIGIDTKKDALIDNTGTIQSDNACIWAHRDIHLNNEGVLKSGGIAIVAEGSGDIHLGAQSRVHGAIELNGGNKTLVNDGVISSDPINGPAVYAGVGVFINKGVVNGDVQFGGLFDNRGGTVNGEISGIGFGDTLITDSASAVLHEESSNESFDTVKSTVTYHLSANVEQLVLIGGKTDIDGVGTDDANTLIGNKGNNHLRGLGGEDFLNGGLGNDTLRGGADIDTFVFKTGYGHDTIADFDKHENLIRST